jgi:hypothetical protein
MVRSITLACGLSGGRGRSCGKPLAGFSVSDGEIRALAGSVVPIEHVTGTAWFVVPCPKHGPIQVARDEIAAAWKDGQRVLAVARRAPAAFRSR